MTDNHKTERTMLVIYRGTTKLVVCKDPWDQFVVVETNAITESNLANLDGLAEAISRNTNSNVTTSVIIDWLLDGRMVTNHSLHRWALLRNVPGDFVVASFSDVQFDRAFYPNFEDENLAIAYAIHEARISVRRR